MICESWEPPPVVASRRPAGNNFPKGVIVGDSSELVRLGACWLPGSGQQSEHRAVLSTRLGEMHETASGSSVATQVC